MERAPSFDADYDRGSVTVTVDPRAALRGEPILRVAEIGEDGLVTHWEIAAGREGDGVLAAQAVQHGRARCLTRAPRKSALRVENETLELFARADRAATTQLRVRWLSGGCELRAAETAEQGHSP